MSLIARKKASSDIPPLDGGTYIFVCVGVIDLGEQYSEKFKNYADKLLFIFEIPSETVEIDGEHKPRWLSKDYTKSLSNKSNLKKDLESWIGRQISDDELKNGIDLRDMVGRGGQISVIVEEKDGRRYNKISSIIGLPRGIPAPTPVNDLLIYDIDNHDEETFEKLPDWIRERIRRSTEWQQSGKVEDLDFPDEKPEEPAADPDKKAPF